METRKVIARNTRDLLAKTARLQDLSTSHELETAWVREAQPALSSDRRAMDLAETRQDRAIPIGTTTEALTALEAAAFAATVAAERAVSLTAVLDQTLAALADVERAHAPGQPSRETSPGVAVLSPREQQVLELVVEGRTNKAIADVLFVSPNTVKTHVASLLTKLRADSRVQLAAIAVRQGLG